MIHEIAPRRMHNEYRRQAATASDFALYFEPGNVLLRKAGDSWTLPMFSEIGIADGSPFPASHYLFSIDDRAFFLLEKHPELQNPECSMQSERTLRQLSEPWLGFAGATAAHLFRWEEANRFCGHCGGPMEPSEKERAFCCPHCGHCVYPRISPVVIVAVSSGERLLMARNLNNPNPRLFLVSGFVDVGETLEQAAAREVLEETGLKIRNVRYVTSQPWGFSDSLIAGMTAELDGEDVIHIQESELAEAMWVDRGDIPEYETNVSISGLLIEMFRRRQ